MIDLRALEADPQAFADKLRRRGDVANLDEVLVLAKSRKEAIRAAQTLQEQRNALNEGMKKATPEERDAKRAELRALGDELKALEEDARTKDAELEAMALGIPNTPLDDVPVGADEKGNVCVKTVLTPKTFEFTAKDHVEVLEALGGLDSARAAKVSGSRFAFLKGPIARLSRAITTFMLDQHLAAGDTELNPPYLVNSGTLQGTGQLPKFGDDLFAVSFGPPTEAGPTPLYLIPTAEVPITNYYADEILDEASLPLRFCSYSPCFRAEAGSAGRDTRGLIRQHQFEKVEMVRFATPAQAEEELNLMVQRASDILTALELPHRVMQLCTGDMGFSSERTFDIEVWLPGQTTSTEGSDEGGQGAYREISSCSSCGSFQARRAKIRYRPTPAPGTDAKKAPKPTPLVTLNGSGLAVGRTLIAVVENHQQADGSIKIPKVLQPYMGGLEVIAAPVG